MNRFLLPVMVIVIATMVVSAGQASQAPGHVYVALRALDQAPQSVKDICNANMDAYLAGTTGPDIALTTYLVAEAFGLGHPGTEAHYERTGQLITNMLKQAQASWFSSRRDAGTAFALGWLTHYCTDCVIHPLVNEFGGYFGGGHDFEVRHKRLELVECEHVLRKASNLERYVVRSGAVPANLICAAFRETFPSNPVYWRPTQLTPVAFTTDLTKSAVLMGQCTQWFVNVHNQSAWRGAVFSRVLKGTPPTRQEYDLLMKPLLIDDVQLELPDRNAGETTGRLVVNYTVNDFRLFKLFCQQWDRAISRAISDSVGFFNDWAANPAHLVIQPERDLDTGGLIGSTFDTTKAWPGNPTIESMLSFLEVRDKDGNELANWPADGKWAPIILVRPQLAQAGQTSTGVIAQAESWNKGKAGTAYIKFPFDASKPGPYEVDLRLAFADKRTKKLYGWPNQDMVVEAKWTGKVGKQPELSLLFLVDCSGSMGGSKLDAAKAAVKTAVDQTDDGKTEWCLVAYGACSVKVHCDFTMDAEELKSAADRLSAGGDTPLTYSKYKALTYLTTKGQGKKGRLIILCDGQDNCPQHGGIRQEEASASLHRMFQQVQEAQMRGRQ